MKIFLCYLPALQSREAVVKAWFVPLTTGLAVNTATAATRWADKS